MRQLHLINYPHHQHHICLSSHCPSVFLLQLARSLCLSLLWAVSFCFVLRGNLKHIFFLKKSTEQHSTERERERVRESEKEVNRFERSILSHRSVIIVMCCAHSGTVESGSYSDSRPVALSLSLSERNEFYGFSAPRGMHCN